MTCPHGYPKPGMCLDCMHDGPITTPGDLPVAEQWMLARWEGCCAANPDHRIDPGDPIGEVPLIGWVCERCAR